MNMTYTYSYSSIFSSSFFFSTFKAHQFSKIQFYCHFLPRACLLLPILPQCSCYTDCTHQLCTFISCVTILNHALSLMLIFRFSVLSSELRLSVSLRKVLSFLTYPFLPKSLVQFPYSSVTLLWVSFTLLCVIKTN